MQFCDNQEFMPREYEIKNWKVVNQALPTIVTMPLPMYAAFQFTLHCFVCNFHFSLKKASGCRLLSSGVTRR